MISFITCTRNDKKVPILRQSLHDRLYNSIEYELIPVVGAERITKGYNYGASFSKGGVYVFIHEDVEVRASGWDILQASKLVQGKFGVLGVAGAKTLPSNCIWWDSKDINGVPQLSGACAHTDKKVIWMNSFGAYQRVQVLDGVFLMCSADTFEALDGFDETIPGWDFYDIDFTYRANQLGYKNTTYPLYLVHHSIGDTSQKPQWHKNREMMEKRVKDKHYEIIKEKV